MTFEEALKTYQTYARAEGKSPKTIRWVCQSIGYFSSFLGNNDVSRVTGNCFRKFIIALQQRNKFENHPINRPLPVKLTPQTIETYCRGVRSFFSFLLRNEFIQTNSVQKVRLPKVPETVMPTFSAEDLKRLLARPNRNSSVGIRDHAIILTLIDTGMRLSELASVKVKDVTMGSWEAT